MADKHIRTIAAHEANAPVSHDITWYKSKVSATERAILLGQDAATIWLTGLSGSGKSTLAFEFERRLHELGHACFVLDGDNVRHGLNRDLGFSAEHRKENIRRIAEVARLFNDAGLFVITAFISPYREDREIARATIGDEQFIEAYLAADLSVCETRDPKGLYKKARAGEIRDFTGVSAPYEPPLKPTILLDTASYTVDQSIAALLALVAKRFRDDKAR